MIPSGTEIFLALEPIDLRCGFNRLSGIAREALGYDPRSGALFGNRTAKCTCGSRLTGAALLPLLRS